jgi:hypothetical protein
MTKLDIILKNQAKYNWKIRCLKNRKTIVMIGDQSINSIGIWLGEATDLFGVCMPYTGSSPQKSSLYNIYLSFFVYQVWVSTI